MSDEEPSDEISRIEARLEQLAEVAERCRKIILASKIAIAAGVALPLFMVIGLFGSNQVAAVGSIAGAGRNRVARSGLASVDGSTVHRKNSLNASCDAGSNG